MRLGLSTSQQRPVEQKPAGHYIMAEKDRTVGYRIISPKDQDMHSPVVPTDLGHPRAYQSSSGTNLDRNTEPDIGEALRSLPSQAIRLHV